MCGIISYVSKENVINKLIEGLKNLEYRGYDSSGIGFINQDIKVIKKEGKVSELIKLINNDLFSNVGIAHTRWATTGVPNYINAHPHLSHNHKFCLIHNGIVENYKEIKDKYLKDMKMISSTDTEVVCNLIEVLFDNDMLITLEKVKKIIKGSYAFNIIYLPEERVYFLKNEVPLIIGRNDNEYALASDSNAFNNIEEIMVLNDGDYGYIEKDKARVFNKQKEVKLSFKKIIKEKNQEKHYFTHHMEKEIYDQIELIDKLKQNYFVDNKVKYQDKINQMIVNANKIFIVACGSSYYSGLIGKYYFEKILKKSTEVILASEAIYSFPLASKKDLFIFVSQSGETFDVLSVLKKCNKLKIPSIGITNSFNSSLTYLCKNILYIYAGKEIAVASTKAFLGQSLLFYILANYNKKIELNILKNEIKKVLKQKNEIKKFVENLKNYRDVFYLGRNLDYYIALEASLKLKEISYIHAEAFPSGELKHGTLALIDTSCALIGLITHETSIRSNLQEAEVRGGKVFIICKKSLAKKEDTFVMSNLPCDLMCFVELIYVQLIAYYTSLSKGIDVDKPRNLAKSVTVQ